MSSEQVRIVFAGTPDFAVPSLRAIATSGYALAGVLTQPDRPAGRGRKLKPSPVKEFAATLDVPILQPTTLKDPDVQDWLRQRRPDLMVIVAYGLLLPRAVLDLPPRGCVNVHASLLPRWRGAAPIQAALLHGDTRTGVCIMRMEAGLDTGPVYAESAIDIGENETAQVLHDRLAELGARSLLTTLPDIVNASAVPRAQDDPSATYAGRIDKADAVIDWSRGAADIHNQIRAYNPWPVAETLLDGKRLRCWSARRETAAPAGGSPPGTVLEVTRTGVRVQTGDGTLQLTELQLPGRGRVTAAELARGYGAPLAGKRLGE